MTVKLKLSGDWGIDNEFANVRNDHADREDLYELEQVYDEIVKNAIARDNDPVRYGRGREGINNWVGGKGTVDKINWYLQKAEAGRSSGGIIQSAETGQYLSFPFCGC